MIKLGGLIAMLLVLSKLAACTASPQASISTHHFAIHVAPPGARHGVPAAPQEHFDGVAATVAAWAETQGFELVTTDHPSPMHTSFFSSGPNAHTVAFVRPSADRDRAMELIVGAGGPNASVSVDGSEGYGADPSDRLRAIYASLYARLTERFGDRVRGSIW